MRAPRRRRQRDRRRWGDEAHAVVPRAPSTSETTDGSVQRGGGPCGRPGDAPL